MTIVSSIVETFIDFTTRSLGGGGEGASEFGVHIKYEELWASMIYLCGIYVMGFIFERILFCPALVGQIAAGIIIGPQLLDFAPYEPAFVLLGEIGLVLLVIEAGVDIDITTLKLIGKRGVIIATLGSIFPIAIGFGIALILGADIKAAIAAGASFGPTSLGIAMNILKTGKIINTPTGQLIVAAAIIDDMIALIILSQLGGLVGEITIQGVLIPIVSALCFLVIGGYIALLILPGFLDTYIFKEGRMSDKTHGQVALVIMFVLVLGLMQATHYAQASHLMGAFIAGLVFCTDHELHVIFVSQFKRVLQWLMRIFFASTIGFQVPVTQFGSGKVLLQGLFFTVALVGKLVVGFMVPNFTQEKNFTGNHLRDCLIVGCSMAAEGEFAFVIAAYAVDNQLIDKDLYSSIVLAILLSTIIAPFSLRFTISYFNKKAEVAVMMAEEEMKNIMGGNENTVLTVGILEGTIAFYCINTTSHAAWGTLPALMQTLFELHFDVIDHRSWHTKFEDTVINEVYVKGLKNKDMDDDEQIKLIQEKIKESIHQEDCVVTVSLWLPGIVDEITEHSAHNVTSAKNITEQLVKEAQKTLDKHESLDLKKDELLSRMEAGDNEDTLGALPGKRVRIKNLSNPSANHLFSESKEIFHPAAPLRPRRRMRAMSTPIAGNMWGETSTVVLGPGEILVNIVGPNEKKFPAKISEDTLKLISEGGNPMLLSVEAVDKQFVGKYLDGHVRRQGRQRSLSSKGNDDFFKKS